MSESQSSAKIGFVSLGCPKALVDSELIITRLRSEGYDLVNEYEQADLVVINTCGFIDEAIEESLDTIGEALAEQGRVIVTGCLGANGDIVKENYPNVLAVTGPHATDEVMQAVHEHCPMPHEPFVDLIPEQGIKLTPKHYAYLKISEGCNHRCSFCIIPALRGDLVSRPIGTVLQDAKNLVNAGVKELLVISQDTSAYGVDVKYRQDFWQAKPVATKMQSLCETLSTMGVWVRLHYVYPYPHVDKVIELMSQGALLPYLDIPFQHANPRILKAMKRPANSENTLERIHKWRELCPEIVIRSTFIVGFPGETDEEFEELLDFLSEAQLDRVGAFAYSPVEGAAANDIADPVDEEVKLQRLERFMQHQSVISANKLKQRVGQKMDVIIDAHAEDGETVIAIGRTYADAPGIDGVVYIEDGQNLEVGEIVKATIYDSDEHDLYAELSD